MNEDLE